MIKILAVALLCAVGARPMPPAGSGQENTLAAAAQSPHLIKHFVDTHDTFEWQPLWAALNIHDDVFLQPCGGPGDCSAEWIAVPGAAARDVILRLNGLGEVAVFLRFRRLEQTWRLEGCYQPEVKYFRPEHRLATVAGKPFLLIDEQAFAGSGLSVKSVSGFDLNRAGFAPAFSYVADGHIQWACNGVGRSVRGALSSFKRGAAEKIRIRYSVSYSTYDCAAQAKLHLGTAFADAVYTRSGSEDFSFDPGLSSAPREEIDAIYWGFDPDLPKDRFLRYDFANLKAVAAGPASLRKRWLKGFLGECPDTPEKRQLAQALALN